MIDAYRHSERCTADRASGVSVGCTCSSEWRLRECERLSRDSLELEDRIADLEDALHQAIHTTEFIYRCLIEPEHFRMGFPDHIREHLVQWRTLAPPPPTCAHSHSMHRDPNCRICQQDIGRRAAKLSRDRRREQRQTTEQ